MKNYRTQAVAAAAILAAAAAIVVPALATPGSGSTPSSLSRGLLQAVESRAENDDDWEARLRTKEDSDFTLDRLTVVNGGFSGWHKHAGITILTVTAGEVVWYDGASPGCPSKTYRVGDSFVEPANNVHLVHNRSGATAEFSGVQIRPKGAAPRIDAAQPADCPTF